MTYSGKCHHGRSQLVCSDFQRGTSSVNPASSSTDRKAPHANDINSIDEYTVNISDAPPIKYNTNNSIHPRHYGISMHYSTNIRNKKTKASKAKV